MKSKSLSVPEIIRNLNPVTEQFGLLSQNSGQMQIPDLAQDNAAVHDSYRKKSFPVGKIRRFIEPGPIVLVSSLWKGERDIMTMGWHTVMEFSPSLIGCVIASANHSFELIRKAKECVINIPESFLAQQVVGIGNCSGKTVDKFAHFGLTPQAADKVKASLIRECYANLECKVVDTRLLNKYNFFILEVVKAHVAVSPEYPRTLHYRGDGMFMVSGESLDLHKQFKLENL